LFSQDIEICLEANPEDVTQAWSEGVLRLGVNRISLGVQTMNQDSLTAIGRSSPDTIVAALGILSATGHQNVNIDSILGLPHVLPGETLRDIQFLHKMFPLIRHASVYFLEK
jgi:oxygen-independent coproporphyrinogen-3 oxidase